VRAHHSDDARRRSQWPLRLMISSRRWRTALLRGLRGSAADSARQTDTDAISGANVPSSEGGTDLEHWLDAREVHAATLRMGAEASQS